MQYAPFGGFFVNIMATAARLFFGARRFFELTANTGGKGNSLVVGARVGEQGGDKGGTTSGERAASRPYVQRGDVTMAHIFLVDRVQRGLLEGESPLD